MLIQLPLMGLILAGLVPRCGAPCAMPNDTAAMPVPSKRRKADLERLVIGGWMLVLPPGQEPDRCESGLPILSLSSRIKTLTLVLIEAGNRFHGRFAGLVIPNRLHRFRIPHDFQGLDNCLHALPGNQEGHRAAVAGNRDGAFPFGAPHTPWRL